MSILHEIVKRKTECLPEIRRTAKAMKPRIRPHYSFKEHLRGNPNLSVIAEIKRGSPSLGLFAPDLDIRTLAQDYESHGASAVSILTDEHFYGSYADLETLAPYINLPILAKDFMIDTAQIDVAYGSGADIILLIAAILSPETVNSLAAYAEKLGMEVILELHNVSEIPLESIPNGVILGLNNRDLKTFEVSIQNGLRQIHLLNELGAPIIAESGIQTRLQGELLGKAGFSGLLIGESLIRSGRNDSLLKDFTTIPRRLSHDTD